jgi:hypothetical protein
MGENMLTDEVNDKIQNNYGLAIRGNTNNAEGMRKSV